MAYIDQDGGSIQLNPTPGFVVKSRVLEATDLMKHGISTKVFINVCHDAQVPKPEKDFNPEVVFPLIIENKWEIPLIVSNEKTDKDKKGVPSLVYDCCINTRCFQWCSIYEDLRKILIEWCIESIELLYEVVLEREYSIPKMLSKGDLSATVIQRDELDESGFQKRLHKLKQSEAIGLIEEMNDSMDSIDEGPLPDLRDIQGKKKPLIEEITDMSIRETGKKQPPHSQSSERKTKIGGSAQSERDKYDCNISYQSLNAEHSLLVKVESSNLSSKNLTLYYNASNKSLVLHNNNSSFYFTKSGPDELEIPLPNIAIREPVNIKAFDVKAETKIYIFI